MINQRSRIAREFVFIVTANSSMSRLSRSGRSDPEKYLRKLSVPTKSAKAWLGRESRQQSEGEHTDEKTSALKLGSVSADGHIPTEYT